MRILISVAVEICRHPAVSGRPSTAQTVTVKNTGIVALTISSITTTSGFT